MIKVNGENVNVPLIEEETGIYEHIEVIEVEETIVDASKFIEMIGTVNARMYTSSSSTINYRDWSSYTGSTGTW